MSLVRQFARSTFRTLLRPRPPIVDGSLDVPGTDGALTIHRDEWHIPHVEATTANDAWFGLGFAQGQDRAFQITAFAHVASGRLAELTGKDAIDTDRLMRRIGLYRSAKAAMDAQPPERLATLEAFTRGLNAGIQQGSATKAVEFTLLRRTPATITAIEVAAIMRLFAFTLAANWQDELARLHVLRADGPDALALYDRRMAPHLPTTIGHPEAVPVTELEHDLEELRRWIPLGGASNNWALRGTRTASGAPIVANDPHLPASLPTFWYLAHLNCPDFQVAGAVLPGTPGFAAAHNGFGAWGTTAGHCDETDLFLEHISQAADGTWKVREADGWVNAEVHREVIRVAGGKDVVEDVVVTGRGPIVGPALEGPDALSMAGTWMDAARLDGFIVLPHARSVEDFHEAFRHWPGMSLNVVWGDRDGHIAWQLAGSLPVRGSGDGTLPLPGWQEGVGWVDRVAYNTMPRDIDPEIGYLATANNTPLPHDHGGPYLGRDHLEGYRLAAIREVLHERDDWTVEETIRAQQDTRSTVWQHGRELVLGDGPPSDRDAALGWRLLERWDGDVSADSPGASVFELTMASLRRQILTRITPHAANELLTQTPVAGLIEDALGGLRGTAHTLAVLDDPQRTLGHRADGFDARATVTSALREAVHQLQARGAHPDQWHWGHLRTLTLHHPVSAAAAPLAAIFDRGPYPYGGDTHTIPQATTLPADPLANPLAIASLRMAVDLSDLDGARFVLPGGQSGDPSSRHYDDQLEVYLRGEAIPLPFTTDAVAAATRHTLVLNDEVR